MVPQPPSAVYQTGAYKESGRHAKFSENRVRGHKVVSQPVIEGQRHPWPRLSMRANTLANLSQRDDSIILAKKRQLGAESFRREVGSPRAMEHQNSWLRVKNAEYP
jgi:hypothetical protein